AVTPTVVNGTIGPIQDAVINSGYLYLAGDRLGTINLSDPTLAMHLANSDPFGAEAAVAVSGGFAFGAEINNNNDGRINIYNVSSPGAPVYVRQQAVAGVSGLAYRALVPLGANYLIAITPDRPFGGDYDIAVIDRTNINSLVRLTTLPIPNFDAIDGVVDGATLYVAGGDGGVAIIDLNNPSSPQIKSIIDTPGIARVSALPCPHAL